VKWKRGPDALLVFPLIAVVLQTIQTALAALGVNPRPIEDTTDGIDAVEFVMGRHNLRLNPQGPQRLDPRHRRIELARLHIVRQPMLRIAKATLDPLFVQHIDIVAQWRAPLLS
jgi:hypothetical protein